MEQAATDHDSETGRMYCRDTGETLTGSFANMLIEIAIDSVFIRVELSPYQCDFAITGSFAVCFS